MKLRSYLSTIGLLLTSLTSLSYAIELKGFNLSEVEGHLYDARPSGQPKTEAQQAVDYLKSIGANHVVLNPIARMATFDSPTLTLLGEGDESERNRYLNLMKYIRSQNMTVGIRPIILLKKNAERRWHGQIMLSKENVQKWFDSMRVYLEYYAQIAKAGQASEFTLGAELYSMTVGLEDMYPEQKFGFPKQWLDLVPSLKKKLGKNIRFMYDINYTDVTASTSDASASGGELERWRYRLADLKPEDLENDHSESAEAWRTLAKLWEQFDMIGIDTYRSLMGKNEKVPENFHDLTAKLEERANMFAADLGNKLFDISEAVGHEKKIIFKELGFKSCTNCFIDPGLYDDQEAPVNILHQAAAYQAFFNAFVAKPRSWLYGISFWDVGVDASRSGEKDPGFSPRGKPMTEDVIRKGWGI